jgi:hypothetical protein
MGSRPRRPCLRPDWATNQVTGPSYATPRTGGRNLENFESNHSFPSGEDPSNNPSGSNAQASDDSTGPTYGGAAIASVPQWLANERPLLAHSSQVRNTRRAALLAFWTSIGFKPGDFMTTGMNEKRTAWLCRALNRVTHPPSLMRFKLF